MDEETEKAGGLIGAGIRILLAGAPGGGWIAQAWGEYVSKKQSERTAEFFT